MDWLDQYEMRARMAPAVIISIPMVISIITMASIFSGKFTQWIIGGGFVLAAFGYMLSFLIRYYGRELENKLWTDWGGAPSTRIMRWRDMTLGDDLKKQLHEAVKNYCKIELSTNDQEMENSGRADEQIKLAFLQVKGTVRKNDPDGIWAKHNAEYGFHRNLLGSRRLWLASAIISIIACGIAFELTKNNILILGATLNLFFAIISILGGWHYLPNIIRITADRYAESIWISFLTGLKEIRNNKY
jgi:hypothetical protein